MTADRPPVRRRPGLRRALALGSAALAATLTLGACGSSGGGANEVALVGYSVPQQGFADVIKAFGGTDAGRGVDFTTSYGASGDQSRKVTQGLEADVVSFSVEPDVTRLVKAGLVDPAWNKDAHQGIPFGSVVSLVVRKGNPKNIHDWDDLLKPGVEVISPNPLSSGSAKWNLLAPYAAKSDGGADPQAGLDFVRKLVTEHIKTRPTSGRDATDLFLQGSGDVLISYENEALFTVRAGKDVDYVDPPVNFKIENPVAVLKKSAVLAQARSFVDYLYTPDAQRLWAQNGFRPVDPAVAGEFTDVFPAAQKLWTVADLGGWQRVDAELFDKANGTISRIYSGATG
ncbi:sulfate ABC transporter substrate-binding protein [Rhodococcus sp. D2-41]|uniref:sulfate ABC transporter substrate-binding protein n=1 Tax=Speluncibacter jeojiensis TaxID=2710754 RepID=UPI002410A24B|nr:sulfate ABC transporter substrate-binding protein [Rhodococcus sp. D2-41]MDG3010196.1 sulfate ABC transporter substrate-binding protein [Rhodococcus sp. D2-41]